MEIKIVNLDKLADTNGISLPRGYDKAYDVYAVAGLKKRQIFLINTDGPVWIKNNSAIQILDDDINQTWIRLPLFKIITKTEIIKYKNLIAPKWMVEDESFLYDIYENPTIAYQKFLNNHITDNFN